MSVPNHPVIRQELIQHLREARRTPIPSDWKPGVIGSLFRGKRVPWGSLDDAWELLCERQIEPGRELLRRICQSDPGNFEANLLLAYDLSRPPEDRAAGSQYAEAVHRLQPDSPEAHALWAIVAVFSLNGDLLDKSLMKMMTLRQPLRSRYGAYVALTALVASSDYWLQHYRPQPRSIKSLVVIPPVKGIAQLKVRQHTDALATFTAGWESARGYASTLQNRFGCRLSPGDKERLTNDYASFCRLAQALTLYDVGLWKTAREIVSDVVRGCPWPDPAGSFFQSATKLL